MEDEKEPTLEELRARNKEWEEQFSTVMNHQGKGIALEKEKT